MLRSSVTPEVSATWALQNPVFQHIGYEMNWKSHPVHLSTEPNRKRLHECPFTSYRQRCRTSLSLVQNIIEKLHLGGKMLIATIKILFVSLILEVKRIIWSKGLRCLCMDMSGPHTPSRLSHRQKSFISNEGFLKKLFLVNSQRKSPIPCGISGPFCTLVFIRDPIFLSPAVSFFLALWSIGVRGIGFHTVLPLLRCLHNPILLAARSNRWPSAPSPTRCVCNEDIL